MPDIKNALDKLIGDVVGFAKDELVSFVKEAKSDNEAFIKNIGELTEEFIQMRADGEVNNDEFKELMEDLLDLSKMQSHKLSADAKVKAERIVNGISEIAITGLLAVI